MEMIQTANGAPPRLTYTEAENVCRRIFDDAVQKWGPFWHLATPGEFQQVIFVTEEDYEYGMVLMAMCAFDCPSVRIITFELMANHIHIILCGRKEDCEAFFELFKKRLGRYLKHTGSGVSLKNFTAAPVKIETLEALRNHIVYVNRNNFLVDPDKTPWSYPYGANSFFFSDLHKKQCDSKFGDLSYREKRNLIRSHELDYPADSLIVGNMISPISFCDIAMGESLFRNARQYFHRISREIEGYRDVANLLGDKVYYTYDELLSAIYGICNKKYGGQKPNLLGRDDKVELARTMHYDYGADNVTIFKILRLDLNIVNEMFPPDHR